MAKTHHITQERLKELLHYDPESGLFTWKVLRTGNAKVGSVAGSSNICGYINIKIDGILHCAHRLAFLYVNGAMPKEVDHINHLRSDNSFKNLRSVSRKENSVNQIKRRSNTSGVMGVTWYKKSGKWNFRGIGQKCADCHADIHDPYLDKKFYGESGCESCHSNNRWKQILFDHSRTDYLLEGAHREQSCRSCHFRQEKAGSVQQEFAGLSRDCVNCHLDVHMGQFTGEQESICLRCHDYNNWQASRFDHDQAAFKLDGKHREVACSKCHKATIKSFEGIDERILLPRDSGEITYVLYKIKDYSCEACH